MGRPSKLTDKQWSEIEERHRSGESLNALSKEFKVSFSSVQAKVSGKVKNQKKLAEQLAKVEIEVERLPISDRVSVRSLADDLKSISGHMISAAKFGSMTAHKLNAIANVQAERIDETASLEENAGAVRSVVVMTEAANKAAVIGLNLLAANKDNMKASNTIIDVTPDAMPTDAIEASRVYQRMINGN